MAGPLALAVVSRDPVLGANKQIRGSHIVSALPNYPCRTSVLVEPDLQVAEFLICCPAGVSALELWGQ